MAGRNDTEAALRAADDSTDIDRCIGTCLRADRAAADVAWAASGTTDAVDAIVVTTAIRHRAAIVTSDRGEVLLAPRGQLPRCPTVRLALPHVCGAWLVQCVRVASAGGRGDLPLAIWRPGW